jgi:tRNA (cytidine/uridine-2'-O-)-methyltransferase
MTEQPSNKIILFSPDIPQNAGNIARTCAVTGARLCLVRPLGFNLSTRQMKRAGLDYWDDVSIEIVDHLESALDAPFYFFSTKGKQCYTSISYEKNACLIFGSETAGLPLWVHEKWPERFYTIPMLAQARSLNLANSVAIVLYEALRQNHFNFRQSVLQNN